MSDSKGHDEKKHHGGGHGGGGGSHEEHEGAPEWLISFADNVTLMMGFFVILLAMNLKPVATGATGGESKDPGAGAAAAPENLDLAIAVREAFHNPVDPYSNNPIDLPLLRRIRELAGESQAVREGQPGLDHDVRSIRRGDHFGPAGMISFARDESTLSSTGQAEVDRLSQHYSGYNFLIEVRGHVSAAEAMGRGDSGMALAHDRARAVGEALAERGMGWNHLRLVACADNERMSAVSYDEMGHQRNQRVEVVVTDIVMRSKSVDEQEAPPPVSPAP